MIIAVDVDDVCADLLGEWLNRINRDYQYLQPKRTREDVTQWDMSGLVPDGENVYQYLQEPDLYDHVRPIPGALQAVLALRAAGHRVIFVTSCVKGQYDAKERWLVEHGFLDDAYSQPDFYPAKDKSLIHADVLIDDGAHNLATFKGHKILIDQPHNRGVCGYLWAASLVDAAALIDEAFVTPFTTTT